MTNKFKKRKFIPSWKMPADPVKALGWFLHWLLKILVRFFWIPIIGMVIFEASINGSVYGFLDALVVGIITLLVGLFVWAILAGLLFFVRMSSGVSQIMGDLGKIQQQQQRYGAYRRFTPPDAPSENEKNVVEGTITDLDEERQKRRRE